MPKVRILRRNADYTNYSSYADARAAADPGDLIQIWATLNEQIILLNDVDIWIAPGVTLDYNPESSPGPTVTDNGVECHCKIYGYGKIVNTYNVTPWYECIKTSKEETELTVECFSIAGTGGTVDPNTNTITGSAVFISKGTKFHLTCSSVSNPLTAGLYIGSKINVPNYHVSDVNINVQSVKISGTDSDPQGFGVMISGSGFVNVDQITLNHHGHCLLHLRGDLVASIRKMTVFTNNDNDRDPAVTVNHGGTSPNQNLVLYFDEIENLRTDDLLSAGAFLAIQGTIYVMGRRCYSKDSVTIEITGSSTRGFVKCNEVISENIHAIGINTKITFDVDYIEGNSATSGVIYSAGLANFTIKNAKIKNRN